MYNKGFLLVPGFPKMSCPTALFFILCQPQFVFLPQKHELHVLHERSGTESGLAGGLREMNLWYADDVSVRD